MSGMKPLSFFLPSLGGGGAERNVVRLAGALAARHEVHLVVGNPIGPVASEVSASVRLVGLGAPRMVHAIRPLARYLAREHPAVLVSAHEHANIAAVIARRRAGVQTALVLTLRNTLSAQALWAGDWRDRWLLPALARIIYPYADRIIALSRASAVDAEGWLRMAPGSVGVIGSPVVSECLLEKAREQVNHEALQPGRPAMVLAVGRLVPEKGHMMLLDAVSRLAAAGTRVQLVVMGDGPLRATLEKEARRLGLTDVVVFTGFQPNPLAWMSRAAVVVLASHFEGLPTVLVEALACGARVVATDAPGGSREILGDGRWGMLVPVGDAAAMASALEGALAAGRLRSIPSEALMPYTEAHVAQEYERLFTELEGRVP